MSQTTPPEPVACPKCPNLHDPRKCTGHKASQRDENGDLIPCSQWPVQGATVCMTHGGKAGQVRAKAKANVARLRAQGEFGLLLEQCQIEIAGRTLEEALTDIIDRAGAMTLAWWQILSQLQDNAEWQWEDNEDSKGSLQRWVKVNVEGLLGVTAQGEQAVHKADEQYRKWLAMYMQANKVAADLGLAERKQKLDEEIGATLVKVVEAVAAELGLDLADPKVRETVGRHLRLLA